MLLELRFLLFVPFALLELLPQLVVLLCLIALLVLDAFPELTFLVQHAFHAQLELFRPCLA